jgi:DivIVA domain-containing protein
MLSHREQELMIDELREASFPLAVRGYDRAAVDRYVEQVNRVIAELEVSRSPEAAVKNAVAQVSEETRGILERAHETAEEITARSRSRADDRVQEAEREAERIRSEAEAHVRELDHDAEAIWSERHRLIEDVRLLAEQLAALADEADVRFPAAQPAEPTQALPAGEEEEALAEDETVAEEETLVQDETLAQDTVEADVIEAEPPPEVELIDPEPTLDTERTEPEQ